MSDSRYRLGLVVGKFAPLHAGHEWLIGQAAQLSDMLLILSYTKPEFAGCGVENRRRWLEERFMDHECLVVDDDWLTQACARQRIEFRPIPLNREPDITHQLFLAWLLRDVLQRQPDALFCCEHYGASCAAVLNKSFGKSVQAVVFDVDRRHVPISATEIRRNLKAHWRWLSPEVRGSFTRRVVILGGESSGKTSLAKAVAARIATPWVAEFGRELWERQGGELSEGDLLHIAQEQVRREEVALRCAADCVICDTSPLTTYGYSLWTFGRAESKLKELAARTYDGVVLCQPDFPFVQDGTRRGANFRQVQHDWYRERLRNLSVPILEVGGSLPQRVETMEKWLESSSLVPSHNN